MNWYKLSQKNNISKWFNDQINELTQGHSKPLPEKYSPAVLEKIIKWIQEENPNLGSLNMESAFQNAIIYKNKSNEDPIDPKTINKNWDKAVANGQNQSPNLPNFIVDLRSKPRAINAAIRSKINKQLHGLGNYHKDIPLDEIFEILESNNMIALQEDGTKWSGMLIGGAECGSEEARNQHALFQLAFKFDDGYYTIKHGLSLSWCIMGSGKYEIVTYIS